ncbi:MAG: glycosyltransferase [Planctomycetota bacterium]
MASLSGSPGWLEISRQVPHPPPLVSVVIPTRDRVDLLEQCLVGLLTATDYPAMEVIIADNDSCEEATFRLFDRLATDPRVRILPCPGPFNYSAINNKAVRASQGEILLLLNNDILIRHPDWLSAMVAQAVRPEVGAVGARLLYNNGTIQHAGVILGVGAVAPVAGHVYERAPAESPGYLNHLRIARNMSAVTAACLAMRRSVFDKVGGFDEQRLPVAFNDVDLCLKIGSHGYQIIWTSQAELTHLESLSRGSDLRPEAIERFKRDIAHMRRTWGSRIDNDPFYGPSFDHQRVDYSLAFPPRRIKTWHRREAPMPKTAGASSPLAVRAGSTPAPRQYAVMHIPKTAGTTLRKILTTAFPHDIYPTIQDLHTYQGDYPSHAQVKQQHAITATRRLFMGHYLLCDLLDLFPDREIITCLREPYAKTVSMIGHFSRVKGLHPQELLNDNLFLTGYVINHQTRYLVSSKYTSETWTVSQSESLVEEAVCNLNRLKIVGLQNRFPQFMARVNAELHFPKQTDLDLRENIGQENLKETLLPYADRIRELIAGDLELYRQVSLRAGSEQVP